MGCFCSKAVTAGKTPPAQSIDSVPKDQLTSPRDISHFSSLTLHRSIFRCPNEWCTLHMNPSMKMPRNEIIFHQKACAEKKPVRCFLCGDVFELGRLELHTNDCISYQRCLRCDETVIRRLGKYCPFALHSSITNTNERVLTIDEYVLRVAEPFKNDEIAYRCVILQTYLRAVQFRKRIVDILFCIFWKEIRISRQSHIFSSQLHASHSATKSATQENFMLDKTQQNAKSSSLKIDPFTHQAFESRDFFSSDLVRKMIAHFQYGHRLPYQTAWKIIQEAIHHLQALPNIPYIDIRHGTHGHQSGKTEQWALGAKVIVVGDIHGQLHDLLHILHEAGLPSYYQGRVFVFNGDFVDRGSNSMEVILLLYAMMLSCPGAVYLNRGNHEVFYMNEDYGFDMEVITKYDKEMYFLLQRSFDALPLGTCIDDRVLVLHGGIPRFPDTSIEFINTVHRFRPMPIPLQQANGKESSFLNPLEPKEDIVFQDILWSDPSERLGVHRNDRGAGILFGPDVSRNFMEHNHLDLVFRSHEPFLCGYEKHHNERVITVFSASDYDGDGTNLGSYAVLSAANVSSPIFHTYRIRGQRDKKNAKPHKLIGGTSQKNVLLQELGARPTHDFQFADSSSVENVLRYIREQIFAKRHVLLKLFNSMDQTKKGTIWKVEWVEAMGSVMELESLPWFFLRDYFAEDDEDGRINYAHFLARYQNQLILSMYKELGEVIPQKFALTVRKSRRTEKLFFDLLAGKYHNILPIRQKENPCSGAVDSIISYGEFEMILNILDIGLSDEEVFHLFNFFDESYDGFLSTARVTAFVTRDGMDSPPARESSLEASPSKPPRGDSSPLQLRLQGTRLDPQPSILELQIMQELQHLFISGKVGIEKAFRFMASCEDESPTICLDDFCRGMEALNTTLNTPLNAEQIRNLFHLIDVDEDGVVSFQDFNDSFSVHDVLSEIGAPEERL